MSHLIELLLRFQAMISGKELEGLQRFKAQAPPLNGLGPDECHVA